MKKILIILFFALSAACTPVGGEPTETPFPTAEAPTDPTAPPVDPVASPTEVPMNENSPIEKVRLRVAADLGYDPSEVVLVESMEVIFRDGCLDAALDGEMCIQVLTPGFRVRFDTPTGSTWYHLNQEGTFFRVAPADYEPMTPPES